MARRTNRLCAVSFAGFVLVASACGDNVAGSDASGDARPVGYIDAAAGATDGARTMDAAFIEPCVASAPDDPCELQPGGVFDIYTIDNSDILPCEVGDEIDDWTLQVEDIDYVVGRYSDYKQHYESRVRFHRVSGPPCGIRILFEIPEDVLTLSDDVLLHYRFTERSDDDASTTWTLRDAATGRLLFAAASGTRPAVFDQDLLPEITLVADEPECPFAPTEAPIHVSVASGCDGMSSETLCCDLGGSEYKVRLLWAHAHAEGVSPNIWFTVQAPEITRSGSSVIDG